MAIIELQRRIAEIGRIRIGAQVATKGGKRPTKLSTFRLTSADRIRIFNAAKLYGGQPAEWEAPAGPQWEVITEADTLNVIVPPSDMCFSQHYELWSGGGCQRRCDGVTASYNDDGQLIEGECLCDPDKRECALHTRLSVMLRDLPGLGVWRIDTSGYYAAVELQGAVDIIQLAAGRGQMLPARLRLEQRMTKRPGQGTRRFAVPVLDIEVTPGQLLGGVPLGVNGAAGTAAIEAPAPRQIDGSAPMQPPPPPPPPPPSRPLTPVSESVPAHPVSSIADQAGAEVKSRKRASTPRVPATGLAPRTATEVKATRADEPSPPQQVPPPPPEQQVPLPEEPPAEEPDPPPTAAMNKKMHASFRDLGLTERDERLAVTSFILGRTLSTSNGMTIAEGSKIIDTLDDWIAGKLPEELVEEGVTTGKDLVREVLNRAALGALREAGMVEG